MRMSVSSHKTRNPLREGRWSESLAVGGEDFVNEIRETLGGGQGHRRSIIEEGEQQQLRDVQ